MTIDKLFQGIIMSQLVCAIAGMSAPVQEIAVAYHR